MKEFMSIVISKSLKHSSFKDLSLFLLNLKRNPKKFKLKDQINRR